MSALCAERRALEAWSREGASAPLGAELRAHAARCADCGELLTSVEELRALVPFIELEVAPERVDAIRFALMSEARSTRRPHGLGPVAGGPRLRLGGALVAVATVAAGAAGTSRLVSRAPTAAYLAPSPNDTQLAPPARVPGVAGRDLGVRRGADAASSPVAKGSSVGRAVAEVAAAPVEGPPDPRAGAASRDAATEMMGEPTARRAHDLAFAAAWRRLREGESRAAADAFEALARAPGLDPGRRSDALYWAARARSTEGEAAAAAARARAVVVESPASWHAPHASLLLGESLLAQGDRVGARRWLEQAEQSDREAVRSRARALLADLAAAPE